jgi:mannose-6-phosphate isomerase-like protein (cupin superfamily)
MDLKGAWVVQEDEAETIERPSLRLLADASHTGGRLGANRLSLEPGAAGARPHFHERSAEAFFVVSGSLRMLIGTELVTVEAGGYAVVPPGVHHAFAASAASVADVLVTIAPGVERFAYFRKLPEVLAGRLPEAEVAAMHERYDVHFVSSAVWEAERG